MQARRAALFFSKQLVRSYANKSYTPDQLLSFKTNELREIKTAHKQTQQELQDARQALETITNDHPELGSKIAAKLEKIKQLRQQERAALVENMDNRLAKLNAEQEQLMQMISYLQARKNQVAAETEQLWKQQDQLNHEDGTDQILGPDVKVRFVRGYQ